MCTELNYGLKIDNLEFPEFDQLKTDLKTLKPFLQLTTDQTLVNTAVPHL